MSVIIVIVFVIVCLVIFFTYRINRRSDRRGRALVHELIEHTRIIGDREEFNRIIRDEQKRDNDDEGT